jgi:hypothetical protein
MSLRKSPELTPQLLAAMRHNARHSTGPRSPTAKQHSKLNVVTERTGNVYENKGSASRRKEQSRNVAEKEVVGMS